MLVDMIDYFIFISLLTSFKIAASPILHKSDAQVIIKQVPVGDTVTLECRSNDENHNFLYWHLLEKNTIVGPGNKYDTLKYNFEVLSGNLTIRGVSENESGLYNCVSIGVRHEDYNIRSTRMIVQKEWEEVYEEDPGVNLFRVVIVLVSLVAISGVGYLAYRIWKNRYHHPNYLVPSDEDEDSTEELFSAPSTSRSPPGNIVNSNSKEALESTITTDFKSILDNSNNK